MHDVSSENSICIKGKVNEQTSLQLGNLHFSQNCEILYHFRRDHNYNRDSFEFFLSIFLNLTISKIQSK